MKNPLTLYTVVVVLALLAACATPTDPWREYVKYGRIDTGSDVWWDTVVRRGR